MLELETDVVFAAIRDRTIASRTSISMKEILAANIPYPVKMFFRTDVESSLLEEVRHSREGSKFTYDHPEIQSLQNQMNSILVLQYTLSAEEFAKRLDDVVHLIANYLIRPQWTMRSVVFEKEDFISAKALLRLLKYFGAYEYLRDISSRYIRDKNISSFTKKDFTLFLWRADGEFVKRKSGDELARVLTPLYEFFDFPEKSTTNSMTANALMKYFEDKGLSSVTARLEGEIQHQTMSFTQAELAIILENVRRTSGAFIVDEPEKEIDPVSPTAPGDTTPPPAKEGEPPVKPFPLVRFAETIDEGDRRRFLRKIFREDEHSYETALQFMGGIASWKDASKFIDEIFIQNNVNPYSSEAVKFIDTIFQQFYPTK